MRHQLVGNPANVDKLGPSKCEMPNEWLEHRNAHFGTLIGTLGQVGFSRADATEITASVLTIHGTKDRNAPYGCGREWSLILPNARLITIPGAAHHSWVEAPDIVFSAIDTFLNGKWPDRAAEN
jgi:pimeloyl-ACP methyl ester carboxylesterase